MDNSEKIGRMSGITISLVMVSTVSYGLVSIGYGAYLSHDEGSIIMFSSSLITKLNFLNSVLC